MDSPGFRADEGEAALRRREGLVVAAFAALLLAPAGALGLAGSGLLLVGSMGDAVKVFAAALFNPLTVLGAIVGGMAWNGMRTRTTRVVLGREHLQVPSASGGLGTFDDGYAYHPSRRRLVVRAPYGRIAEVRRVTDPLEQDVLRNRGFHTVWRTRGAGVLVERVRGHVLAGPGSEAGAPALLADELRTAHVTDPERAVALTFRQLARRGALYPALPERIADVTLYVSVDDPDALVAALAPRVAAAEPLPAEPGVGPLVVPPPAPKGPAPNPPARPAARPSPPARPPPDPIPGARAELARAVAIGAAWWVAVSGATFGAWLVGVTGGVYVLARLLGRYEPAQLVVAGVAVAVLSVPGPLVAGALELALAAAGAPAVPRRVALSAVIGTGPGWALLTFVGLVAAVARDAR